MNKTTLCYTIDDIANWQKEINGNKTCNIKLPSLQRGFIWKPYQIENLWDSILRGYPIGSLLMNNIDNSNKDLLDGQQRSTSIAIGYLNPFETKRGDELLNIKKNIPSLWIDIKPVENSDHGLKFGIRTLTRSHPWGYQLRDNRKTLTASDRENALKFFRQKAKSEVKSFSEFEHNQINPWDAHLPIPLFVLLKSNINSFEKWYEDIRNFIEENLKEVVKTKYSEDNFVVYTNTSVREYLENIYSIIKRAKEILIPEILVHKNVLEEKEEHKKEDSDDATLFVRLNSEGTRISGEELIYSLLKSTFPEAKDLVEDIGVNYIAPSKIVNLFARLSLIEVSDFENYQKDMNLIGFRRHFLNEEFKSTLISFIKGKGIGKSNAKTLFRRSLDVVSFNKELPKAYIKHQITNSIDLFFVLLVYLYKNNELTETDKKTIHKDFHSISLFSDNSKTRKIIASELFKYLKVHDFNNWSESIKQLKEQQTYLVFPLISANNFRTVHKIIIDNYIKDRGRKFDDWEYIKSIFKGNRDHIDFLFLNNIKKEEEDEVDSENRFLDEATNYWFKISKKIYWDRAFLFIAQKEYFNKEFKDFMEFDGVEDTNRPWDWDHIYPNSWVYNKKGISPLVKHTVNTNGNYRALSFNENRSQSNKESPRFRFYNNKKAQKNSFIGDDLKDWLEVSNSENRLQETEESKDKINAFVNASFKRMNNIYEKTYQLFVE